MNRSHELPHINWGIDLVQKDPGNLGKDGHHVNEPANLPS